MGLFDLFTPAWNSENPEKRIDAVKKTTSMEELVEITKKATYEDVQQKAWKRIVFEEKNNSFVRFLAAGKITGPIVLKILALKDSNSDVRRAAVINITDKTVLKEIADKDTEPSIRKLALKRITILTPTYPYKS